MMSTKNKKKLLKTIGTSVTTFGYLALFGLGLYLLIWGVQLIVEMWGPVWAWLSYFLFPVPIAIAPWIVAVRDGIWIYVIIKYIGIFVCYLIITAGERITPDEASPSLMIDPEVLRKNKRDTIRRIINEIRSELPDKLLLSSQETILRYDIQDIVDPVSFLDDGSLHPSIMAFNDNTIPVLKLQKTIIVYECDSNGSFTDLDPNDLEPKNRLFITVDNYRNHFEIHLRQFIDGGYPISVKKYY